MSALFDPSAYQFTPHAVAVMLTAFAVFATGVVFSVRQWRYRVGRLFGAVTLPIAWWLFCFGLMAASASANTALLWSRMGYLAIPLITPAAYHFSVTLLRLYARRRRVVWLGWACALIASAAGGFTPLVVAGVHRHPWGFYPSLGAAGLACAAFSLTYLILTLAEYWLNYRKETSFANRMRVKSFMTAFTIGSFAAVDYFVYLGPDPGVLYPVGYLWILLFLSQAIRTVRRYRLIDFTPSFAAAEIVETMADALIVCDAEGHIRVVNHAVATMLGYDPDELVGRSIEVLVDPDATLASSEKIHQALKRGTLRDQERVFRTREGKLVEVSLSISQLRDRGAIAGSVVIARDIRARKHAEAEIQENVTLLQAALEALRASESRYRLLFERNSAGVFRTTFDGRIIDCNDACAKIFGYASREELMGQNALDFYADPDERGTVLNLLREIGTITNLELQLKRKDGSPVYVLENVTLLPARDDEPHTIEGTLIDITDRKLAEEQIEFHAYHDALTSLPNRKLFTDRLTLALFHARRTGNSVAVLSLDLDLFKAVIDTFGHTAGDELLVLMAARITTTLREGDTVARLGGDEFAILIPDLRQPEDAAKVAETLLAQIQQPISLAERELYVTASLGIALYPNDGNDPETLLKNADSALQMAKEAGRSNYQLCTPQMKLRAQERLSLEHALRHALDRSEFRLHFQPLVNLEKARVTGLEALIRWHHPHKGVVLPDEFIPLAEDSRLIVPLGQWVLREACQHAREWTTDGLSGVRVSVNLSARQFQQRDLVDSVRQVLEETGLSADRLELEITETTAMQNAEFSIEVLRELRDMGVRISIDDFGTGYSSLNYLKRFPINTVKIDKAFVRDVTTDPGDAAIVAAVIGIARSLNLRVIAEGVETLEQIDFLRQRRCDEMQGYFFGAPMPAHLARQNVLSGAFLNQARVRLV
jgi:diguanylate cyclase (GGDEF)-like protein/PAS domain S-box-containing protein